MKKPKIREIKEAVTALFKGPYTVPFPKVSHKPFPGFRGAPKFFPEYCVGCGACVNVCPTQTIKLEDDVDEKKQTGKRKITLYYQNCEFCGFCQECCITGKGVQLTDEFDLSTFDRKSIFTTVEKELALCEICGEVVTTWEHLKWLAEKLGPLAYTNPGVLTATHMDIEEIRKKTPRKEIRWRFDQMRVLCAKHRREVYRIEERPQDFKK